MMVRTTIPASGMKTAIRCEDMAASGRSDEAGSNPLARLIRIMRQNDDLLGRLEAQGRRLARARAYSADPASNPTLATVLIEHERSGYTHLLSTLRANRVEALEILRACGHADAS